MGNSEAVDISFSCVDVPFFTRFIASTSQSWYFIKVEAAVARYFCFHSLKERRPKISSGQLRAFQTELSFQRHHYELFFGCHKILWA